MKTRFQPGEHRTSARQFSRAVTVTDNSRLFPETPRLVQWHFTYRMTTKHGPALVSSFHSVVSRAGMPGWWLDMPYFCYGGQHHCRRLPARIEFWLRVAIVRGKFCDAKWRATDKARDAVRRARFLWSQYKPSALIASWKARREWAKLGIYY